MNLTQLLKETSHRRVSTMQTRNSAHTFEKKATSGCESESYAIDLLLDEAITKFGGDLVVK